MQFLIINMCIAIVKVLIMKNFINSSFCDSSLAYVSFDAKRQK